MIVVDDFDFFLYLLLDMAHRRLFVLFYFFSVDSALTSEPFFLLFHYPPNFPVSLLSLHSPASPEKAKAV